MHVPRTRGGLGVASLALTLALLAVAPSCGGGGSSGPSLYVVSSTDDVVAASTPIVVGGQWIVYLADEAGTGMDLNMDGDMVDSVAAVIDAFAFTKTNVGVAALGMAVVGSEIYMAVSEADDDMDWNMDLDMADRVLLHWSLAAGVATFVEELDPAAGTFFEQSGTRLYYIADPAVFVPMAGETNLHYVDAAAPTTPVTVVHTDIAFPLRLLLIGADEGLVFLAQDETVEGRDLNGDGDMLDGAVLALLDGTDPAALVQNVGLAVNSALPYRALNTATSDWTVAFLVNEADQGNASLNNFMDFLPAWRPTTCMSVGGDLDALDDVLHFLEYAAWSMDPVTNAPTNTGLAGGAAVAIVDGYVATVSPEASQDDCDLNADGDMADDVVQYISTAPGALPQTTVTFLLAVDTGTPGGTGGLSSENDIFTIALDEAAQGMDVNGNGNMTDRLFGWQDPAQAGMGWQFDQDAGAGMVYVGVDWMSPDPTNSVSLVALQEVVFDPTMSINLTDADVLDSVPTFTRENFTSGMVSDLDFPGIAVALNSGAPGAGIVVARSMLFYRVSEAEDNFDWNNDGDTMDNVLLRSSTSNGATAAVSTLNSIVNTLAITTDGVNAAAFIADEAQAGKDFNGNGNMTDLVVRWFRIQ